ncbi:MAG: homocysteine S-methyltransferase family protein [Halofilum sp. (in: g-proteobacteria)]|nr:homocysteine S-methyltransferase family protein [Halofilum sp. (in: g-proteobacteria)]
MANTAHEWDTGRPLLLDGGMGQELAARGLSTTSGLWSAHALLSEPDTVLAVHRDFIDAGADVISTNTYATTRRRLDDGGEGEKFEALNRRAGELARQARSHAGREVLIAGSLPPIHGSYRPDRVRPVAELEPLYHEQAALLAEYVDVLLCETMSTASEALAAARGAAATGSPVWVAWTVADDGSGRLRSGESIADALAALADVPVSAVLLNCSMPESIDAALPGLARAGMPYGAYANGFTAIAAGDDVADGADVPDARTDMDPTRYAGRVERWLDAGASIVGGCCEVGPEHIARLRAMIDDRPKASGVTAR